MASREELADLHGEDLLFMDGYDDCIVGVCERFGMETVVAYDKGKVLDSLTGQGMSMEEAVEWFYFNQIGGWHGDKTPVFLTVGEV